MPTWQPKFDSFLIHDPGNGFFVGEPNAPIGQRIATQDVPRRHGSVLIEEIVSNKRAVTVLGSVKKATSLQVRTALEDLARATQGVQVGKLYLWDDRYVNASLKGFDARYKGPGLILADYTLELQCNDPFFYADTPTSDVQVIVSDPTSWAHVNSGSLRAFPIITITADVSGDISAFTLTNVTTGKAFAFSGTVTSGKSLIVDCAAQTVKNDGNDALANWPSGNIFWWLNNGSNTILLSGATATVTIAYNAPFYGPLG